MAKSQKKNKGAAAGSTPAATPEVQEDVVDTPTEETSTEETPTEETSTEETPTEETPTEETPTEETPAEETPAEETSTEETPTEETPAEETPAEETPAEEGTLEDAPKDLPSATPKHATTYKPNKDDPNRMVKVKDPKTGHTVETTAAIADKEGLSYKDHRDEPEVEWVSAVITDENGKQHTVSVRVDEAVKNGWKIIPAQ